MPSSSCAEGVQFILEAAKLRFRILCFANFSFSITICILVPAPLPESSLSIHSYSNSCLILAPLLKVMLEVGQKTLVIG